ncbi:hypothetical protein EXU57_20660 [Segetibacter sp. 3557_3]|uniref:FUSC family protein n=1 Tax=Segetibacter sp. 3557_3 TaxID=2547429 RepID=UPI0010588026|nr:FUSC family membrane protein [Segetibacter sp. 3557_3]TDH20810.1 hypothetical protein EXU57_20660 [Segetibacter sp. 3557_3]
MTDYIRAYKSFINSHYLTEAMRMTVGILLPAFILEGFDKLEIGIVMALGGYFVSIADGPGPVHHRRNGMLICTVVIFLMSVVAGLTHGSPWLFGVVLAASCFLYSMIGVFGARATSIGIAGMVVLVLSIEPQQQGRQVVEHAAYLLAGGIWYFGFSLLMHTFRPYKLLQQALGESIENIASYLRTRAGFYKKQVDYDAVYKELLQQQASVQEKQNMLNDLIFKTRSVVKETTHTGRVLVLIHLDAADVFEKIMTSYQSYPLLHEYFDKTGILDRYYDLLLQLAAELDEIGLAVKSVRPSHPNAALPTHIEEVRGSLDELRHTSLAGDNIEGFISLRRILESIDDLYKRLQTLHRYTTYDRTIKKRSRHQIDYGDLTTKESVRVQTFRDNLTLQSDIFRHSLRVCVAATIGFVVSQFFSIGHSYWILLTVIVILKPAYSLTKKRNSDRLLGTILGVLIGMGVLQLIHDNTALLLVMIVFMAANFSVMRRNYFLTVMLMTPYLIVFYHLMHPDEFRSLLKDRVIDTAIGSVIAFTTSFLLPAWERTKMKSLMIEMLEKAVAYFTVIAGGFAQQEPVSDQERHIARKDALVALANLSDAFNRMLSEPKSQQKGIELIHQFVVLNHMLTSYLATLAGYVKYKSIPYTSAELNSVIEDIRNHLFITISLLRDEPVTTEPVTRKVSLEHINREAGTLMKIRQDELKMGQLETETKKALFDIKSVADQFNLLYKAAAELQKVTRSIKV